MSKGKLSKEEKTLLDAVEAGEFESVLTEARKSKLQAIAGNTFKKDKRINIRISNRDLTAIQTRASEEGIPYQTYVSSIIHKYISGSLQDLTANKQMRPTEKKRAADLGVREEGLNIRNSLDKLVVLLREG